MQFEFDSLILLIGTNPLPNYVVAEFFLQNNPSLKNLYLIHSEQTPLQKGTGEYARNLEEILKIKYHDRLNFPLSKTSLSDVGNAKTIQYEIEDLLKDLPPDTKVHINYTGGTKVMGIHVYRIIERSERIKEKSFSYLDGRSYRIICDNGCVIADNLRNKVKISFKNLVELHRFKRLNEDSQVNFSKAVEVFRKLIDEGRLDDYYSNDGGYKRYLFENKKGSLCESKKEIKNDLREYIAKDPFLSVVSAMPDGCRLFDSSGKFLEPTTNKACEDAIRFLDGGWLEEYVYSVLKSKLESHEVLKNWEIKRPEWEGNQKFELDVILLNGYQLIGISCTTSGERHLCKSKGFEIIHRTRQIGGDEAKAILVTKLGEETAKGLQEELVLDTGQAESNIMVLGKDDLKEESIVRKISDFIEK